MAEQGPLGSEAVADLFWRKEYQRLVEAAREQAGTVRVAAGASQSGIGVSVPRQDVLFKVRGKALYAANLSLPGMLNARFLRSPHAHARICDIRTGAARRAPGIHDVLTAADIPEDRLLVGPLFTDTPILAKEKVRFVGEPVAAVAGESLEAVDAALRLIEVDYEPLPGVFSAEAALEPGAPLVHDGGNTLASLGFEHGDLDRAFAEADIVLDNTFANAPIDHCFLEAQAGVAFLDGDGVLTLMCCTQYPHFHHKQLARVTGLAPEKVRVIKTVIGGAFGGKIDVTIECVASLFALRTRRPVKIVLTREEVFEATTKRHVMHIRNRVAARRTGELVGVHVDSVMDGGAYHSYSLIVAGRNVVHAAGPYVVPNVRIRYRTAFTNHVPAGAMRSFGVVKTALAMESQLDDLALRLGMSPIELRKRNALREGSRTITGQVVTDVGFVKTLDAIEAIYREQVEARRAFRHPAKRMGLGVACLGYGIGYSGVRNPSVARLRITDEGDVRLYCGTPDIGTGSDTALAQIAAEAMGIAVSRIQVVTGDSTQTDDAGPTSASRTTYFSGNAAYLAGMDLRAKFLAALGESIGGSPDGLGMAEDRVSRDGRPLMDFEVACKELGGRLRALEGYGKFDPDSGLDLKTFQGNPYPTYTYATHLAVVLVDTETGTVEVPRYWAAHDAGVIINPSAAEGQIEGGVVMGLGLALWEKVVHEDGRILNPDYLNYLLPGTKEMPEIRTIFVESRDRTGPYGAKGVAEASIIPTPAAVANGIFDAVGVRLRTMPFSSEEVYRALQSPRTGSGGSAPEGGAA